MKTRLWWCAAFLFVVFSIGKTWAADGEMVRLTREAAEKGSADAQYSLAVMYDTGNGIPMDYAEAARWYRKAAENGNASAQYIQGINCLSRKEFTEAKQWLSKAAIQGHNGATFLLNNTNWVSP